jgi:four helix bundle protein
VNAGELKQRTFEFGQRIIRLVRALPKTVEGRAIGAQLVCCGTAVGANYRACCKSRSRAEFVARIGVVEEEADESAYWLETLMASQILKSILIQPLLEEARELERIFGQSRVTAARAKQKAFDSRLQIGNRK